MKRIVGLAALLVGAVSAQAQAPLDLVKLVKDNRTPVRIPIRSADPWMVKMMIEGTAITQPEYSTLRVSGNLGGGPNGGGSGNPAGGGLGGGTAGGGGLQGDPASSNSKGLVPEGWYIVVNPTDNSLWLYPKRGG